MTLHLIKLCVGVETAEDLSRRIAHRVASTGEHVHVTRMFPKRRDDIVAGGSIYWVIKGLVLVRQRILDLRPEPREDGGNSCAIVLEPVLVATVPQPRRPFQGWRYLDEKDAPADWGHGPTDVPIELRTELARLGLL